MRAHTHKCILYHKWLSMSIKKKIVTFSVIVFLNIIVSILFNVWFVNYSVNEFGRILGENVQSSEFVDAIEMESSCFKTYMKNSNEDNKSAMERAFLMTEESVNSLPYDYASMTERRFAKTWSIQNSYEIYKEQRDYVLVLKEKDPEYIKELYQVYDMQNYLEEYARILMRYTLEEGNAIYVAKEQSLKKVPIVVFFLGILLFGAMILLTEITNKTIMMPIMKLVRVSKKIASNDFFVEDVIVENQDEMGELVKAFNKMKFATGQYITTLEESKKMIDLLHKEELEKVEIEKNLEKSNLELLKSQINPHFLFNTLNVISGMANLEDAKTTEKMIQSLSTIFRYNLKTPQNETLLANELQVVKDYMYLQQMRFGVRVRFHVDCKVDLNEVLVPTFTFQPLVENAIIHGLSKKEEGGSIYLRIWEKEEMLYITIADTGIGMTEIELEGLRNALKLGATAKVGIGLGNIYKRIHGMYEHGELNVYSRKNAGTVMQLILPFLT